MILKVKNYNSDIEYSTFTKVDNSNSKYIPKKGIEVLPKKKKGKRKKA